MSRGAAIVADDPTPQPTSTITPSTGASHAYFAEPTPEMLAMEAAVGAAYEEGRALYGDEDGDAWLAALESGVHPLCRVKASVPVR